MILAIDPGKDKSGIAVVSRNKEVKMKTIVPTREISGIISDIIHKYNIEVIVLGDGTSSSTLKEILKVLTGDKIPIKPVAEDFSTVEAEKRFKKNNPVSLGKKIIGLFLDWKPSQPLDDITAVILAERYIDKQIEKK
ncbi:MAG: resolvase [Bacillota bacterium]